MREYKAQEILMTVAKKHHGGPKNYAETIKLDAENKLMVWTDGFMLACHSYNGENQIINHLGMQVGLKYPNYEAVLPDQHKLKEISDWSSLVPILKGLATTPKTKNHIMFQVDTNGELYFSNRHEETACFNPYLIRPLMSQIWKEIAIVESVKLSEDRSMLQIETGGFKILVVALSKPK
jgi:hypothetical protein